MVIDQGEVGMWWNDVDLVWLNLLAVKRLAHLDATSDPQQLA